MRVRKIEEAWFAIAAGTILLCIVTAGLFSVAQAGSDIRIQPQEFADRGNGNQCRIAHDRLEHDNMGNIKGISTFYVCPNHIKRTYREVK